jgi:hypothetical protein
VERGDDDDVSFAGRVEAFSLWFLVAELVLYLALAATFLASG